MASSKSSRLLLIDGSAIMHRAYHALPSLTDRQGKPIGAVYGFTRMLLKAVQDLRPQYVVVALDRKEPTFRKAIFIGYQAHRPPMEEELGDQFTRVRELLDQLQVPVFDQAGFEADDIIGTITSYITHHTPHNKKSNKSSKTKTVPSSMFHDTCPDEVIILTGDKDLMQLVTDRVKIYLPIKGVSETELVGPQEVKHKLGISPDQVVDYKALVGDPSDNYPGVYGVGPKTAVQLLNQYHTFENIYRHLDDLKGNLKDKLVAGREGGELSRQLAQINTEVQINYQITPAPIFTQPDKLSTTLANFGFKTMAQQVLPQKPQPKQLRLG
jgi:DNA polymerase-1